MKGKIILLVEDDAKVQTYNRHLLEKQGFIVKTAMTLASARSFLANCRPDIIVLDRGMPDGEGLDLLCELREEGDKTPVLLLTGYGGDRNIELGFDTGCDDYLPKPYTFGVLHKRLIRLLQSAEQVPDVVSRGSLTLKLTPREAYVNGENLRLAPKYYALLQFFIQNENRLMSNECIYEAVWGQQMVEDSQALNTAISRLRKKLTGCGYTIAVEYGIGYRFERGEA